MNKYQLFRHLHQQTQILIIPNAWDPLSARILEQSGFSAIATTSWGMAGYLGHSDGEHCSFTDFMAQLAPIIAAVSIPVSVDIESGYSNHIDDICQHVLQVAQLGAVGINIEDSDKSTATLRSIAQQSDIIHAIKRTLIHAGFDEFFINARTDTYLCPSPSLDNTLARAAAYQAAGADGLFIPGMSEFCAIQQLSQSVQIPLNIMSLPHCSDGHALFEHGVKRFSTGNGLFDAMVKQLTQMSDHLKASSNSQHLYA